MEEYMIFIWMASLFVSVIIFVKWWMTANDITAIKNKLYLQNDDGLNMFDSMFFALILAKENERAKIILFEEISKTKELRGLLSGVGGEYFQKNCDILNDRYKRHLNALGMQEVDFSIIKK